MMKNLLNMRSEIETQIRMIKQSKHQLDKNNERKRLEKDLDNVIQIIQKK